MHGDNSIYPEAEADSLEHRKPVEFALYRAVTTTGDPAGSLYAGESITGTVDHAVIADDDADGGATRVVRAPAGDVFSKQDRTAASGMP
jgi:hypothetical protein